MNTCIALGVLAAFVALVAHRIYVSRQRKPDDGEGGGGGGHSGPPRPPR